MRSKHEHLTVTQRVEALARIEEDLSYRTDIKMSLWCGQTSKDLSRVQERVFAQIYGIRCATSSPSSTDYLFRWLMAHTGETCYDFRPTEASHYQWPKIISRYFNSSGHFAELVILEKILLAILRSRRPYPLSDVFMADRIGDKHMKTDWMFHRQLAQGLLQMGIQISIRNHVRGKVADILKRPISDIEVFDAKKSPMIHQFMRHTTAVISFPHFPVSETQRKKWHKNLLEWSREYQSRWIKAVDDSFEHYARWIEEIFCAIDEGIRSRTIGIYPYNVHNLSYDVNTRQGDKVKITHEKILGQHVVILEFFRSWVVKQKSRPIVFALPLHDDFLNIYRDMLGVRAQ